MKSLLRFLPGGGISAALALITAAVPSRAAAETGQVETYVFMTMFTAPELTKTGVAIGSETHDTVMKMDDSDLWGFGMGYQVNDRLNINGDLAYGSVGYSANWGTQELKGKGYMWEGRLGFDFNLMTTALKPYVSGGIGFSTFDSGVPSGPPQMICWWDPWWGNVCSTVVETHRTEEFTYYAGVGLRWDIGPTVVLKASYNLTWMEVGATGTTDFPEYRLSLGWRW